MARSSQIFCFLNKSKHSKKIILYYDLIKYKIMVDILSFLQTHLSQNSSFLGLSVILINIGSRYIVSDFTPLQQYILSLFWVKVIVFFCMCFLTTRNVKTSFVLTISFFIIIYGLLNEKSKYNIIPPFLLQKIEEHMKNQIENQKTQKIQEFQKQYHQQNDNIEEIFKDELI